MKGSYQLSAVSLQIAVQERKAHTASREVMQAAY
jgi:hypothetical protein